MSDIGWTLTKIKWAYQDGTMWVRFVDWLLWRLAWSLPRKVAAYAFIRVYACDGQGPGEEFDRVTKAWDRGEGR